MKAFSAFLDMKKCKDWDHEISSWKHLTMLRPVSPVSLERRVPHSPPWTPLSGCWRSAAAAAQGSVSAEADGKCTSGCCSVAGNALAVPICSWEASHVTHDMRPSLKHEQWLQASCSEELRALNAATKKRNTWDQMEVLAIPGHASLLPLSIGSLEQREIVLTQEIILTLFGYWLFFLSFFNEV